MTLLQMAILSLHGLLAILIIILTLLHAPKSGGLSIGGSSQQLGSAKSAEQSLVQITGIVIKLFFITGFVSGYFFRG